MNTHKVVLGASRNLWGTELLGGGLWDVSTAAESWNTSATRGPWAQQQPYDQGHRKQVKFLVFQLTFPAQFFIALQRGWHNQRAVTEVKRREKRSVWFPHSCRGEPRGTHQLQTMALYPCQCLPNTHSLTKYRHQLAWMHTSPQTLERLYFHSLHGQQKTLRKCVTPLRRVCACTHASRHHPSHSCLHHFLPFPGICHSSDCTRACLIENYKHTFISLFMTLLSIHFGFWFCRCQACYLNWNF